MDASMLSLIDLYVDNRIRYKLQVGVHFDSDEAIAAAPAAVSPDLDKVENGAIAGGSGRGFQGFYFFYWQNSC